MFHIPDYYHDLSWSLSEVLHDIGVNKTMMMKRRKAMLLLETMETISKGPENTAYMFGSQSEGTTTPGLLSDIDILYINHTFKAIQTYGEWQHGLVNLLITRDANISPGYCYLQILKSDSPIPDTQVIDEHYVKVSKDTVLVKNTLFRTSELDIHGPSFVMYGAPGIGDKDLVPAILCQSWPQEAKQWLNRRQVNVWPTSEIKTLAKEGGCFLVPVGSEISQNEAMEWRISASLAERHLMFSLNITQIRCYILMKMILKTYLNSQGESHLSSFMCKTVLLYCIENSTFNTWKEVNLISCLSRCLQRLSTCVLDRNCPHFIIPGNNLMAGRFLGHFKHELHDNLCHIMQSLGGALFGIQIDDLSLRLTIKHNTLRQPAKNLSIINDDILPYISGNILQNITKYICSHHMEILQHSLNANFTQQVLLEYFLKFANAYRDGNISEKQVSSLLAPLIYSMFGSLKASVHLRRNNNVPSNTLELLHKGFGPDVSSGRLKLASVLYCMGDMERTEVCLREIKRRYNGQDVEPICGCHNLPCFTIKQEFSEAVHVKDTIQGISENTAFCVKFTPTEKFCIPHELQYEMFRSTTDERLDRNAYEDSWMDWAVVDSLIYLHFLEYKTYGRLQRRGDQLRALADLDVTTMTEDNLGHRETALNLLGQCMEQENCIKDALFYYSRSLTITRRNNVARIHICRLLANIFGKHVHASTRQYRILYQRH